MGAMECSETHGPAVHLPQERRTEGAGSIQPAWRRYAGVRFSQNLAIFSPYVGFTVLVSET